MKDDTRIVTAGRHPHDNHGVVNPPIYRASTILYPDVAAMDAKRELRGVYYGRGGVPTTFDLEDAIAALEGAHGAVITGSGKTAIAQAMMAFLKAGDHVLMVDSTYAPTRQFCDSVLTRFDVETTYYDPLIGADIASLIRPNTKIVYLESPGSQTFEVQDVPAIAKIAHDHGAIVMLDNTWASPLYFKPFEHGVDISIHAATKYICGHSDVMMGIVTSTEPCYRQLRTGMQDQGSYASPDDCYLAQRGLRTLSVRLARHQENGIALASWLKARPEVARVMHPALPDDPGHALWKRDFLGASGLFGVELHACSSDALAAMLDPLELFGMGYSWGGYESLVIPTRPEKIRTATGWRTEGPCLRFHAGLEDIDDLTEDLEAGFTRLKAAT